MRAARQTRPRRESGLEVDVPDHCFVEKPWFPDLPSAMAVVPEIKHFIPRDGRPFMWRGHSHTHPRDGSKPVYLDEFELPVRLVKAGRLSPCPCCTPTHAKYGKGRIAYFPDERVIRLIGYCCFKSLDKEAHENAEIELRQRKRRDADINYLLGHHDRLRRAYSVCANALPIAHAIDKFSKALRRTFDEKLDLPIWNHVQQGYLPIWKETTELKGDGKLVPLTEKRSYAPLRGYRVLKPDLKSLAFRLEQVAHGFKTAFDTEDWDEFVADLSDQDRSKLAKVINQAVGRGRDILEDLRELQSFVGAQNIATLRTWGQHVGCPMPVALKRSETKLLIGKKETAMMTIHILPEMEDPIGDIDVPLIKELDD